VEQDLAMPIQSQLRFKAFTVEEIKHEIEILNQKKGTKTRLYYCQNAKNITKKSTFEPNVCIKRHTATRILAYIISDGTSNTDTQTWEKSNRRFILTTNQLITDNFKNTRKALLKKINKDLNPQDWNLNHQF
jgi:hypothetical protein